MPACKTLVLGAVSLGMTLSFAGAAFAQRTAGTEPLGTVQPVSKDNNPATGATDTPAPVQPPSKQENKAIKTFRDVPQSDPDKKTQLGEEFIATYPQSQFRPEVVLWLARVYLTKQQVQKLQEEGDKEMALNPTNPLSLAVLGSNLSRAVTPSTPDKQKYLDVAEAYCKKSLEDLQTAKKPANLSDEKFTEAKNQTAATAYSGLGTVAFRNQKYNDAITNLDQAVKLGGAADPVNFYLLGKANEAATNFDQALAAYTKCAAIGGPMQSACQESSNEVKAHGAVLPK